MASFQVRIRKIKRQDLEALADLYKGFRNEKSSLPKMKIVLRKIEKKPDYIILNAFDNNRLIGTLMAVICNELYGDCHPFAVIEDVIVNENYRRQGIGRALMKEIEIKLRKRKCKNVLLITDRNRINAQRFYESLGFSRDTHKGYKKSLIEH
jgi:ribosomal protein S18 acetylase RimI-like enzyme